ncbi:hypothetical protein [Kiloniella majae]|uniref:hypothetical protein n=1 Tax=Kiloniella majae TaxID=1938558 RepID=UPI000A277116|nr:hypothetical protein [Kiloniella majae]
MKYQVTLIEADIREAMNGEMSLAIKANNETLATLDYFWTPEHFTARFNGFAPTMPKPAHPMIFLGKPIESINTLKQTPETSPVDVFKNNIVEFDV